MAVTPTGIFSTPLSALRTMLAGCKSFQTWVGAKATAELTIDEVAAQSIYLVAVPDPHGLSTKRPFACIRFDESDSFTAARDATFSWRDDGSLTLIFEWDVTSAVADAVEDAELTFLNSVGGILADLCAASEAGGALMINRINKLAGPSRAGNEESRLGRDYYQAAFTVSWSN